ncbi:DUF1631 family protein [Thiohalobacter thiocyanaticus]|uniref:DUF1631 domain-containing protein n=1 Tax=Thiohalobacter thiocyanaticus TaxID=585455 RepID=A0A426QFY1_9GAMM|nr:DUF1631 family protein [Thiohalobacter thiocyanaticus]RRQ20655.1 DUF1631 domain-containing protein [Thiohalobacter thiocyanaticus]
MTTTPQARTTPLGGKFGKLMESCRRMTRSHLAPLIRSLLEQVEVALLEAADKAGDNQKQLQYFDTMNLVKRNQDRIAEHYLKTIDAGFERFIQGQLPTSGGGGLAGMQMQQLALVDKQAIEYELPVKNLVAKANAAYADDLYGLDQRLAVVNGGERVPEPAQPGGPVQLAQAFADALQDIEMAKPVLLILFALYDRHVIRELQAFYDEYNRRLVSAGILPNLRYEIRKHHDARRARPTAPPPAGGAGGAGGRGGGNSGFSVVDAPAGNVAEAGGHAYADAGGMAGSAGAAGNAMLSDEELDLLSDLRRGMASQRGETEPDTRQLPPEQRESSRRRIVQSAQTIQDTYAEGSAAQNLDQLITNLEVDADLLSHLQTVISTERRQIESAVEQEALDPEDADIIDLVGLLFDRMLAEQRLPNAVKALLSRLHTPYLKIGLLDKAFFMRQDHPARRLLDRMVDAGGQWVMEDDLQRGIFPCLRETVERIMQDYAQDPQLFEELEQGLGSHIDELEHKTGIIENRAVEAANGQERLGQARRRAHAEIARIIAERHLPEEAAVHLTQVWAEKLMFILLRERDGEASPAWKLATRVLQDVIESIETPESEAECERRQARLPRVQTAIRDSLGELSEYGRKDTPELMKRIQAWQEAACDPRAGATTGPVRLEVLDLTLPGQAEAETAGSSLSALEQAHADHLEQIDYGTWFQFMDPDSRPRRLRLAWYSKLSKRYLFVDPMGVKAAEYTRDQLARRLAADSARIVQQDPRPFVDRVMDTVLSWIADK